jgi:Na+/melibiose symporter-like transporter
VYGVTGMVREKQKAYQSTYAVGNIIGTPLCILSPLPLILSGFAEKELLTVLMLCVMLALIALAVFLFITVGVKHAAMQRLLKEGEFAPKVKNKTTEAVGTAYWLIATAVYLAWSLVTNDWQITWIVWPIAAILYGAVMALCRTFFHKDT